MVFFSCNVLYIVDLALEGGRRRKFNAIKEEEDVKNIVVEEKKQNAVATASLENKIENLSNMKAKGLINDEEYNELKKKIIQYQINK